MTYLRTIPRPRLARQRHLGGPSRPWCWCMAPGPTAAAGTRWWPACNARATPSSPSPPRCARSPTTARIWPQSLFPSCFANDLPAKQAAVLAATQRPISTLTLAQPSGPPAWADIPSWALVGTVDRVILPATQLFMAERADARIVKVKASHLSMISRPGAVTGLIVAADRATR